QIIENVRTPLLIIKAFSIFFLLLISTEVISQDETDTNITEKLQLNPGLHWISFPRLERYGNEEVPTIPVLERYNYPNSDFSLEDRYGVEKKHISGEWEGNLNYINSTRGYIFDMEATDGEPPHIGLYGAMLDPETEITIPAGVKEWIGYFLPDAQYPWDAFPDELYNGSLVSIKAQYWAMSKDQTDGWIISGKVKPIKYGDMVIVRTTEDVTFIWDPPIGQEDDIEIPAPQNYTWDEKKDYTPFYIETDSTSDIIEIAVKVDGETKGATVRQPGDTLVEVDGYILDIPAGAVVEFETWNGYKSTPVNKDEYIVYNPFTKSKEKRKIYTGERQPYYKISFKQGEVFEYPDDISHITCQPNPFNSETTLTMRLNMPQLVWIEIYNISGAKVKTLLEGELPGGYYETTWYGDNDQGNKVEKGIYFYKVRTGSGTVVSNKIVLIK
ncbi:MAG: T9SS type A sorting domain-containing protein, partial [Bacteroidales bacterium]|nr:T9SS type A sorting domain-containing protein [Bacteroidales bacterium]